MILKTKDGLAQADTCPRCDFLVTQDNMVYKGGVAVICKFCERRLIERKLLERKKMVVVFDKWFSENNLPPFMREPFTSWLENRRGVFDTAFEPKVLNEEWLSFLFYLGRKVSKQVSIFNAIKE